MHKVSFIAIGAATIGLLALSLTSASAGYYDSGYNSGDTDTVTIGPDPYAAVDPARDRGPQAEPRCRAGWCFA